MLRPCTLSPLLLLVTLGCANSDAAPPAAGAPATTRAPQPAAEPAKSAPAVGAAKSKRRALLVGCSKYDHVKNSDLVGPANDVILFRDLLLDHFEFNDAPITILADIKEASGRPTKANIKAAFEKLAKEAQAGDDVVILLGGHGFYIPDDEPNEEDPEPDGLDECFLPCDTQPFTAASKTIGNSIRDDELREWLANIRNKGAFVWIVVDACHSGTAVRSIGEVERRLKPEALEIPSDVAEQWANLSPRSRGGSEPKAEDQLLDSPKGNSQGKWVAMYGAQSTETAPELLLPVEAELEQRQMHGLLTFTIRQILTQSSEKLTYDELIKRVQQQYTSMRSMGPTPLAEGDALAQEVLGDHEWPGRSRLQLKEKRGLMTVNGGTVHGLSNGTILGVFPIGSEEDAEPLGYVKIKDCSAVEAEVTACNKDGNAVTTAVPQGMVRIVKIDYSYLRPTMVGFEPLDDSAAQIDLKKAIQTAQQNSRAGDNELLQLQDNPQNANWVVRTLEGKAYLIPSAGWPTAEHTAGKNRDVGTPGKEFGPFAIDDPEQLGQLAANLGAIARAQNLLKLAPAPDGSKLVSGGIKIDFEVRRHADLDDLEGTPIPNTSVPTIEAGELIGFHITNKSATKKVDVTLLYVDANYGISALFPDDSEVGNRMAPGEKFGPPAIPRQRISSDTTGLEHLVLVAVEAKGPPLDFTWLAQAGVSPPTDRAPFTGGIDKVLDFAVNRKGTRAATSAERGGTAYVMRTITLRVPKADAEE